MVIFSAVVSLVVYIGVGNGWYGQLRVIYSFTIALPFRKSRPLF